MVQNFKNLRVYQDAYALARDIYKATESLKGNYRIKDQIGGSSTSICTNLAEMSSFENKNQQKQKISTCIGEANETEFWLDFYRDVGHLTEEKHKEFLNKLKPIRMSLFKLLGAIKKDRECSKMNE
ncbi:MAG: hypothetical protein MSIBF_05780 [Candidatus Altiarchaeales archaeon IMC4]|nr:MAG: hypothetical protein MSIBF_05780 [Candidatus Altiarchaeales archaeon IMC4]